MDRNLLAPRRHAAEGGGVSWRDCRRGDTVGDAGRGSSRVAPVARVVSATPRRGARRVRRIEVNPATAAFSLIELLVAMGFLAGFTVVVQQFCTAMLRGVRVLEVASEAQETARLGIQLIVADAREAGFAPAGRLSDGVRRASRTVFGIARDLNGDGDVDDANERVTYSHSAARRALMRAQGDASPQPLVDGLPADGLRFTYFDETGGALDPGAGELDAAQRARIRRVTVHLAIALPNPDPARTIPLRAEEQATATLRNGP